MAASDTVVLRGDLRARRRVGVARAEHVDRQDATLGEASCDVDGDTGERSALVVRLLEAAEVVCVTNDAEEQRLAHQVGEDVVESEHLVQTERPKAASSTT